MVQCRGPLVLGKEFPLEIGFLFLHELQDPRVFVILEPVAMLIRSELHLQVVEPVLEPLQAFATFRALIRRGGGAQE